MAAVTHEVGLEQRIHSAIEEHAKALAEEDIKAAVSDFERHLRELVGKVAISVSSYYNIRHMGPEMVITVKLDTPRVPGPTGEREKSLG